MTDTQPIIETVERLAEHKIIGNPALPDRFAVAVVPEGKSLVDLQPYLDNLLDAPRRIETTAKMTSVASLTDYLNRFKGPDSAVFAADDASHPSLTGIVDFHGQGAAASPQFGKHRAVYDFHVSDQLRAWSAISGRPLSHQEMASFIDERQYDIANPPLDWMQVDRPTIELILHLLNISDDTGSIDDAALDNPGAVLTARDPRAATVDHSEDDEPDDRYIPRSALYKLRKIRFGSAGRLIQLARTVEIGVNAKTVEGYNPKTGERTVRFEEEHEARDKGGRQVTVPDAFLLNAPVWEGETPQLIPVRLQYRRTPAGVKWFLTLTEWRRVIRWAVKAEADRVKQATGLPVFFGAP